MLDVVPAVVEVVGGELELEVDFVLEVDEPKEVEVEAPPVVDPVVEDVWVVPDGDEPPERAK